MFDPDAKEAALREESESWDTTAPLPALDGDVPVVDVGAYFATGSNRDLQTAARDLQHAAETVGFHQLLGHGIAPDDTEAVLSQARRFFDLPDATKSTIRMDRPEWPLAGSGYLPVGERKLPRRAKGNANEAFVIKCDREVGFDENQWLDEHDLPGFRNAIQNYARLITDLALRLLPVYAAALDLAPNFFESAFRHAFSRLRLSHYPPAPQRTTNDDPYGIAPHVDTTFFTLLLQGGPGLTLYSHQREAWVSVPVVDGAFVVNSGELLRQWSNDRFLSTRHFAHNSSGSHRYSVPFFFNATSDYPMECLPTCQGPGNPPKYPAISYQQSQGVVQGE